MKTLKEHRPLIKAVLATVLPYLGMLIHLKFIIGAGLINLSCPAFMILIFGIVYVNVYEYFHHKIFFHVGVPGFEFVKIGHVKHHQYFCDDHFASRDPEALANIVTPWYIFPVLFVIHYAFFWIFLRSYIIYAPAFFFGVVLRFLLYEVTHWCTHVKDNKFDQIILRIPILGRLRKEQINFHHKHHDYVKGNFSFAPIYLDKLLNTKLRIIK